MLAFRGVCMQAAQRARGVALDLSYEEIPSPSAAYIGVILRFKTAKNFIILTVFATSYRP